MKHPRRFTIIEVTMPKSGPGGWGVYDVSQKQVVNSSRSRRDMEEWADALNLWEVNRSAALLAQSTR